MNLVPSQPGYLEIYEFIAVVVIVVVFLLLLLLLLLCHKKQSIILFQFFTFTL